MKLDPVSLKLFIAVMEEGAITRAARREHLAISAASKRLSELEQHLGTSLFARSNRGIEATAAAFTLLHLARGAMKHFQDIELQMRDHSLGVRGSVRIFANVSAITQFLPGELSAFLAMYPGVQIRLQERISSVVLNAVADNVADLGIMNAAPMCDAIEVWPYHKDRLVLVVPAGHALADLPTVKVAEALRYDFIGMHPGSAINQVLLHEAHVRGLALRFRIEVSSFDALCLMVSAGLGIGVTPRKSAELFLPSLKVRLVEFEESWANRQLLLCTRPRETLSRATVMLLDHLRACASAVQGERSGPLHESGKLTTRVATVVQ
jgi:DNA-binding transcriptional LysR family regulator